MPHTSLYYHLVWSTCDRQPVIDGKGAALLRAAVVGKCATLKAFVYAASVVADHVHLLVAIPATMPVDRFVGQVKGAAAYAHNRQRPDRLIAWQHEYGAITVSPNDLTALMQYVRQQAQHHDHADLLDEHEPI